MAITSILSQSDENFASGNDSTPRIREEPDNEEGLEGFGDDTEQLGEIQAAEPVAPKSDLPVLKGKKVGLLCTPIFAGISLFPYRPSLLLSCHMLLIILRKNPVFSGL